VADCVDVETCDGRDNDGDGLTDEGFPDADLDGTADCVDVETCDGRDNDGDGSVDEGFPDADADGTADCVDVETCDGRDNDGDGSVDEGLTCTYTLLGPDLVNGPCPDDDMSVWLDGALLFRDANGSAGCVAPITFNGTPGQSLYAEAYDTFGICRSMTDVFIRNDATGATQLLMAGADYGCGFPASSAAFWWATAPIPASFP
jgi:hypothetical protein